MRKLLVLFIVLAVFIMPTPTPTAATTYTVLCKVGAVKSATWAKDGFLPSTVDFALASTIAGENAYRTSYPLDGKPDWNVNGVHVVPNWQWVGLIELYATPRPYDESKRAVVRVAAQADFPGLLFVFVYSDWTQDHPNCGFWITASEFWKHIRVVWL